MAEANRDRDATLEDRQLVTAKAPRRKGANNGANKGANKSAKAQRRRKEGAKAQNGLTKASCREFGTEVHVLLTQPEEASTTGPRKEGPYYPKASKTQTKARTKKKSDRSRKRVKHQHKHCRRTNASLQETKVSMFVEP